MLVENGEEYPRDIFLEFYFTYEGFHNFSKLSCFTLRLQGKRIRQEKNNCNRTNDALLFRLIEGTVRRRSTFCHSRNGHLKISHTMDGAVHKYIYPFLFKDLLPVTLSHTLVESRRKYNSQLH